MEKQASPRLALGFACWWSVGNCKFDCRNQRSDNAISCNFSKSVLQQAIRAERLCA